MNVTTAGAAKLTLPFGTTSLVVSVYVPQSGGTRGALTGLLFGAAGLTCYYKRGAGSASVVVTLATIATLGTYASGGFKEIDATNMPGLYEFHPPDAGQASGSGSVTYYLQGAANMAPVALELELVTPNSIATSTETFVESDVLTGLNANVAPLDSAHWFEPTGTDLALTASQSMTLAELQALTAQLNRTDSAVLSESAVAFLVHFNGKAFVRYIRLRPRETGTALLSPRMTGTGAVN